MSLIAAAVLLLGTKPNAWALVNVLLFPLLTAVIIAAHEGGHALAGRALGLEIPRVEIGVGRSVGRWRWGRTTIRLHAFPLVGITVFGATGEVGLRWRIWLAIAAGPAVTLAMMGTLWLLPHPLTLDVAAFPIEAAATRPALRELFVSCSLFMLVGNLLPFPWFRGWGWQNDGLQLLFLPFRGAGYLRELMVVPGIIEARELGERDDHDGAQRLLEEALRRAPGSWAVLNSLAIVALDRGDPAEARAVFLDLLGREPPVPAFHWIARNNLAWADFLIRDEGLRAEADEHSAAVAAHLKQVPWALGTRGAVLVWLGRFQEALRLLERAYLLNSQPKLRASNACCLALALAALERCDEAQRWLERARNHHAGCPLLREAEAALERASASPATALRQK